MENEDECGKSAKVQCMPEMQFTLPAWRINEITQIAARILCEAEYYADGFDCRKMIESKEIVIKGYSEFLPENLEKMRKFSPSFWSEGLCLVFPDDENGRKAKMICYNDRCKSSEQLVIILHEYGHIFLRHTEQSMNGEAEAICFATAMAVLLAIEQNFHLVKRLIQEGVVELDAKQFFSFPEGGAMK